ncbi:alkaline phosphatase PhoX [uncultured Sphingomonas sp.]|uniref:PhoX family protein n=1 Tax=uncultured Sphingomonas sp. TaxID=158754 RepID=UPI0035CA3171
MAYGFGLRSAWGYDDGDIETNRTANPHLSDLVAQRYSRRQALFGGVSAIGAATLLAGCGGDDDTPALSVSAGDSITTSGGRMVNLVGGVSGGTATASSWTQVSGPPVALTPGATGDTVAFSAPNVASATPLVFRFSAVNQSGPANADTTVTINTAELGFTAVAKSLADTVAVPAGYSVTVLYRLGDPINAATSAYANNGTDTGFSSRAGDHHDGMSFFGLAAGANAPDPANSARGLLVLNHENITQTFLHANGPTTVNGARPEAEALKEIEAHGVSVIEVSRAGAAGAWSYAQGSALNRRITPNTPMDMFGPARGVATLRTAFSPTGVAGRGTINNCANGYTPWNTYLTAEENWVGYFRRTAGDAAVRGGASAKVNTSLARYGAPEGRTGNYGWATVQAADPASTLFRKWNITATAAAPADGTGDFRNEIFQYGWIVEIDPFNPASTPRKRTALGRMNHEGAWPGRFVAGTRPAWYMGDDAQNEYIYKFVSTVPWVAADASGTDRLALGDKYLDAGTLYVARFDADGTGRWLPLVFGQGPLTAANAAYPFDSQADVLINARLAGDALGATRMDRPEWTAVNPANGEMYCTLTNNSSRTTANTNAANPRAYTDLKRPTGDQVNADPPSPPSRTSGNPNGQVIRLRETGDTTEATAFTWDVYAFGSGADLNRDNINLSGLDDTNDFSSPDGLWFSRTANAGGTVNPLLWLQTDDGAYTDVTNCMLLLGQPGRVGDGTTRSITNTITPLTGAPTTGTATARVGAVPGTKLRRFLVGPVQCEITGIDSTPDGRSVFINIQHPGEDGSVAAISSNWPANQGGTGVASPTGARPRSATIVITKNDGAVIGL